MATCARCGTIMPGMPGAKCPACGAINDPLPAPPPAPSAQPPAVAASAARPLPDKIDQVGLGLTLVIWAAVALLLSLFAGMHGSVAGALNLACFLLALAGVMLIGSGLGFASGLLILHAVLMFVPLVNLLLTLVMVARARKALKAAGRRVGFLGVKR